MPEVVHPRDGDSVTLRPCPPWCTEERHFTDDEVITPSTATTTTGPRRRCRRLTRSGV